MIAISLLEDYKRHESATLSKTRYSVAEKTRRT